ncbi:hypothetical protein [Natronospora cellulosivora (SeqCode)]
MNIKNRDVKKKIYFIVLITITLIFINFNCLSINHKIDEWHWLEKQGRVELWQRKSSDFISEILLNNRLTLRNEVLRGYTIRFVEDDIPDFNFFDYPIGVWKVYYTGCDNSGNIYLRMHTLRDGLSEEEIWNLMSAIEEISKYDEEENDEDLLKMRFAFFNNVLDDYLDREGVLLIVDSSKSVVINGIEQIPALNFILNDAHTVVNIQIGLNN